MPPKRKLPEPSAPTDRGTVEPLAQVVQALAKQVEALTNHVQVLREAIDEIREDFQWAVRNDRRQCRDPGPIMHITSIPKDPCSKTWEVNRIRPEDLPTNAPPAATSQAELF